ncbi:hypothetical protein K450DRAFT_241975 [Umbelopsis ramanniana AG]|uniref:Transforming growth factor beta regulator 1 n=1 Tax=Umbelopsis ramanniana AG TaxID=1314678 RepID=A0AAD5HDW2_UMBRA|nr:uncharacterized protein K450DRAFT_241975 [Umbelopsis ramanniana AG]KAI8579404.1 hypothetical protein K450DRAFT_241975 [Umbelopsis ramanniana AG]
MAQLPHSPPPAIDHPPANNVKVKVYYTFKGNATTCLCTFETSFKNIKSKKLLQIPLKRCLLAVCSSCPDMLSGPHEDCAVYTASFEESELSTKYNHSVTSNRGSPVDKVIWEGHGLMSWILDDTSQHELYATGKVGPPSGAYEHTVEVILQLQPTIKMSKSAFYDNLSRESKPSVNSSPPSNPRLTAPIPIHPQHYTQRKRSDDQNLVRRYYEHREQPPPVSLPSLTQSLPPYPSHHDNHHPSSQQEQKMARMERNQRLQSEHYYDNPESQHRRHRISPPTTYQTRPPSHQPRDRYPYPPYPPQGEGSAQYDRLAWRDEGPWLRITDSQQPPYANPSKSNDIPAYEARHPMPPSAPPPPRSPSTASATSDRSSTEYHHQQHDQPHMENNNAMKHPRLIRASTAAPASESNLYPYRLPLGKTIHHTRRKKRDTKPPNANELRTIVELEKDDHGDYKLPVEVDSWTVISLGKVIWDKPAFHNQRYIYPVGYVVKKWYRSMIDPHRDTQYICSILDGGNEPLFRLQADDNPKEVFQGQTPTSVWTIAVRRAFAVRNMEYGHNPVGPDFFGLRKNTIAKMIQDLPNADKCRNYVWQMFEIGRSKQGRGTKRPQATLADDVIHQHQFEQSVARGPIGRIRSVKLNTSPGDANSTLYPTRSDTDIQQEDDEEDEMDEDE